MVLSGEELQMYYKNLKKVDFTKQVPAYGTWASPNMVNTIEENGKEYNVMVIPDHNCVVNSGLNSVRGGLMASTLFTAQGDTKDRLKEPLIYRGRKLYETTWEESTGLLAKVIAKILQNDSPNDIAMATFDHGGGGGGFENTWGTGKLFFKAIGTISCRIHNRPAYNSEVHASREMGIGELNSSYYDCELADTIMMIATNPVECQTNFFFNHMVKNLTGESLKNKKKEFNRGESASQGKFIVVDPRRTVTVKTAEKVAGKDNVLHLQLKPGTDVTLMNALVTYIVEQGWHAKSFIRKHTEGFNEMYWIGYEKGVIWGIKNYECIASIVNLALVTQSVGRVGTGVCRMGGHQEGYARPPYGGPPRWKLPVIDEHIKKGDYKVFFIWGCDPTVTSIDAEGLREALARRSEIVKRILDEYEGADLDTLADKVYEACKYYGGLLIVDIDIYPRPAIANAIKTELERQGRPDLAKRFEGFNWKTEEDAFNDGFRKAGKEEIDSQGGPTGYLATYDRLRKAGNNGVQLPIKAYKHGKLIGTRLLYTDYKFGTKSGKAKFLPTPQPPIPDQIKKMMGRHKYWINNGRLNHMWQSNYHTLRLEFTKDRWPLAPIFLHEADMKDLGLKDGC